MGHQPTYTVPARHYLDEIIRPDWRVFEYGSGASTLYFHERVSEIVAVEHSDHWAHNTNRSMGTDGVLLVQQDAEPVASAGPSESEFFAHGFTLPLHHENVQNEYHGMQNWEWRGYASQIYRWPPGHFNVVAVDGMARSLCLYYAGKMCADDGFIILDNSCRWQYNDLQQHLIAQGWHRRDFWQPGHPGYCTSFFSRSYGQSDSTDPRAVEQGDLYHAIGW